MNYAPRDFHATRHKRNSAPTFIDPNQTRFVEPVESVAAPAPVFSRINKSPLHRIAMHVAQLLDALLGGPHIEVVETSLPEGRARAFLKQRLQYLQTKYGYTGRTTCSVEYKATTTIAHMQQSHNAMVAQWRSQGKKIVETGWTYNGAPALTGPAPDGPVAPAAKPQTRVPDPDDQPMPAKKSVTPPAAAAHTAPAAAPTAATAPETYVFCYSMGSPYRGTARSHYYITSVFASSNAHVHMPTAHSACIYTSSTRRRTITRSAPRRGR